MGYEWKFVEYKNISMQKKFYNKDLYKLVSNYIGSIYSVPLIQEWEAISNMKSNGILNGEEIIVPGYSGDFIAGSHISEELVKNVDISVKDVKSIILNKHFNLNKMYKKKYSEIFLKKIEKEYNIIDEKQYSQKMLIDITEMFDFQERQSKFISNAVRIYEYYGFDWYMPLWDKKLVDFWKKIDYNKRYDRKLYIRFTEYIYPELMEYAPIVKDKKNKENKILKKILGIYKSYCKHTLNYYGYMSFMEYLTYVIRYHTLNYYFMFAKHYIKKLIIE